MSKSDRTLLDEIESDVLSSAPLADALRKCITLGGRSGSTALRDWATKEARGYEPNGDLPGYREVAAPLLIDGQTFAARISGQRLGVHQLPEAAKGHIRELVPFHQGVGELESLVKATHAAGAKMIRLSPPGSVEAVALINHAMADDYQAVTHLYWEVHVAAVEGIIDGIRTTLVELLAEMRAGTPAGQAFPTEAVADQAVRIAVTGDGNRVTVLHSSGADQIGDGPRGETNGPPWWRSLKVVGSLVVGIATIAAAILAWPGPFASDNQPGRRPVQPSVVSTP
jgi:hypothetical protein